MESYDWIRRCPPACGCILGWLVLRLRRQQQRSIKNQYLSGQRTNVRFSNPDPSFQQRCTQTSLLPHLPAEVSPASGANPLTKLSVPGGNGATCFNPATPYKTMVSECIGYWVHDRVHFGKESLPSSCCQDTATDGIAQRDSHWLGAPGLSSGSIQQFSQIFHKKLDHEQRIAAQGLKRFMRRFALLRGDVVHSNLCALSSPELQLSVPPRLWTWFPTSSLGMKGIKRATLKSRCPLLGWSIFASKGHIQELCLDGCLPWLKQNAASEPKNGFGAIGLVAVQRSGTKMITHDHS